MIRALEIDLLAGFMPQIGDRFELLDGIISGRFDVLDLPELSAGELWDVSRLYVDGSLGVAAPAAPVPEPSSLIIFGIGAIGAVIWRRRKPRA